MSNDFLCQLLFFSRLGKSSGDSLNKHRRFVEKAIAILQMLRLTVGWHLLTLSSSSKGQDGTEFNVFKRPCVYHRVEYTYTKTLVTFLPGFNLEDCTHHIPRYINVREMIRESLMYDALLRDLWYVHNKLRV